ncbi:hypothetical protein HPB48_018999 [Haemaphysalis longicornis]|uniref:Uncharacterized protein n=1 Tax=Haemaphysalis longicornis TaxID=44386 RepID=A0A9J6GC75_HAELO|nr:hypothetical protein HPB48_018999 [Haemaphysalis longicornis]
MKVHSCESGFNAACGIAGCAASFRRYLAYRQHVYRKHAVAAGIKPRTSTHASASGDDNPGGGVQEEPSFHAASPPSEERNDNSVNDNEPSNPHEIQKQLALFYFRITEKLKLPSSTADEVFTTMKSLMQQLLDYNIHQTLRFLEEENVQEAGIKNLQAFLNATSIITDIFSELGSIHMRKKYLIEHFAYTDVEQLPLETGTAHDTFCYIPITNVLSSFLQTHSMFECFTQPLSSSQIELLTDFMDGDFFSQNYFLIHDADSRTIFLLVYTDELVITNPLGSTAL